MSNIKMSQVVSTMYIEPAAFYMNNEYIKFDDTILLLEQL